MSLPSVEAVNDQRVTKFLGRITESLAAGGLDFYRDLIERYEREHDVPAVAIAAALAKQVQGNTPLLLDPPPAESAAPAFRDDDRPARKPRNEHSRDDSTRDTSRRSTVPTSEHAAPMRKPKPRGEGDAGLETFRIAVGEVHGVRPNNIVGAIANEAGIESRFIGRIDIRDDHSLIDLPQGMPEELLEHLKNVWVAGQKLKIQRVAGDGGPRPIRPRSGAPAAMNERPDRPARPERSFGDSPAGAKPPRRSPPAHASGDRGHADKTSGVKTPFSRPSFAKPAGSKPSSAKPGFGKTGPRKPGPRGA